MHRAGAMLMHVPSMRQQACDGGCGQKIVAQDVPSPCGEPPAPKQSFPVSIKQRPLAKQQACGGNGQLTVAQVVPAPWGLPPWLMQSFTKRFVQRPLLKQHAWV